MNSMGFKWGPFRATFGNWMAFYRLSHLTNNLLWLCVERRPKPDRNSRTTHNHSKIARKKTQIECVRQSGSNCIRYCVASKSATYWEPISKALQLYLTNNLSVLWTWKSKVSAVIIPYVKGQTHIWFRWILNEDIIYCNSKNWRCHPRQY